MRQFHPWGTSRLRENSFLHATPRSAQVCWYQDSTQDAQQGHPARPQRVKRRIVLLSYVEPLNEARTPLVDLFRILLETLRRMPH